MTISQEPSSFQAMFARLGSTLDQWGAAHAAQSARLDAANARILDLEHRFEELNNRFTKVLEESFKEAAPDTLTLDDQQRLDLADKLKTLFDHADYEYTHLFRSAGQGVPKPGARARWLADFLRFALLSDDSSDIVFANLGQHNLSEQAAFQINQLIDRSRKLRRRAADLDPAHVFSFDSRPGPVDPGVQRAWKNCDPKGDIVFAVTPSYSVGTRLFLHQQVFTNPRQADAG